MRRLLALSTSLLMALAILSVVIAQQSQPKIQTARLRPTTTAVTGKIDAEGFDTCPNPTVSQMQTWWTNASNLYVFYPYIGGDESCSSGANIDANWFSLVLQQGWDLVPTWVGPQMPYPTCSSRSYANQIPLNNNTAAYNLGASNAQAAAGGLSSDGISPGTGAPIAYDLEGFNTGTGACVTAARYFIEGWDHYMNTSSGGFTAGVYGSTCASDLQTFASISDVPHFIWGAQYDGNPSTSAMSCVGSGDWAQTNRHKQYTGSHNETHGTVTLNVDDDCSNGIIVSQSGGTAVTGVCS